MLKTIPLTILAILVLSWVVLSQSKPGVDTCNGRSVRNILVSNMVTKVQDNFKTLARGAPSGSPADDMLQGMSSWTATIEDTVQTRYDDQSGTRYCQATIHHENYPSMTLAMAPGMGLSTSGICKGRFAYQIQTTTEGKELVQWRCLE